jgi:hypothetical protein
MKPGCPIMLSLRDSLLEDSRAPQKSESFAACNVGDLICLCWTAGS